MVAGKVKEQLIIINKGNSTLALQLERPPTSSYLLFSVVAAVGSFREFKTLALHFHISKCFELFWLVTPLFRLDEGGAMVSHEGKELSINQPLQPEKR